jgi:hypothetical protein
MPSIAMTTPTDVLEVKGGSTTLIWIPDSRLAVLRYDPGTTLRAADGVFLAQTLTRCIAESGESGEHFGVLADYTNGRATDAEYRAEAREFFQAHRDTACVAIFNASAVIRIAAELFRVATGIRLKALSDEVAARSWLRSMGIGA